MRRLARLLRSSDGFSLVELTAAIAVLSTGMLAASSAFESSQKLSLISERHAAMAHVAQQEIERLQTIPYGQLLLTDTPVHSSDPGNPDYYVNGSSFQVDRSGTATEPLATGSGGSLSSTRSWSSGQFTGSVYDFVTWSSDSHCGSGCTASNNYKRLTVGVTISGGAPKPVWVTTQVASPQAAPTGGVSNGTSISLPNPATSCQNSSGTTITCSSPIGGGTITEYPHDCSASCSLPVTPPSADHITHDTVQPVSGLVCTSSQPLAAIASNITGCPVPDLIDGNPPGGSPGDTCYKYSTDAGTSGYPCGLLINPTCQADCVTGSSSTCTTNCTSAGSGGCTSNCTTTSDTACTSNCWTSPNDSCTSNCTTGGTPLCTSNCGTGGNPSCVSSCTVGTEPVCTSSCTGGTNPSCTSSCTGGTHTSCTTSCSTGSSDCSDSSWTSSLIALQSHFWVSSPVTTNTTLNGDGGLTMYTQTANNVQAFVTFCIELYDVPPSGTSGSLKDLMAWPPVPVGGTTYTAAKGSGTGNWPTTATQSSFSFNFRGSQGPVTIAAGHRIGVRVWMKANVSAAIALIFDNPAYPTEVQLNTS